MYAGNLAGFFQHEPRIYTGIVPTNTEEQMRPGGAARRADAAQEMALLDLVAHCDLYVGQMKVHADETVAVIDEHGVSLEEHLFGILAEESSETAMHGNDGTDVLILGTVPSFTSLNSPWMTIQCRI